MSVHQEQPIESAQLERCPTCGRQYTHTSYLDHLFKNKECMRRFWKEEERAHVFRLRHRERKNVVKD